MLKQFGSAAVMFMAAAVSALMVAAPAAAQVSRFHQDFKPSEFNAASPGLAVGEVNIGPTQFAMPGFGWDENHGQQARPGVFFPNVSGLNPEDATNRAFVFLFGNTGQNSSTFTSTTTPGNTFPVGGIDPTLPANNGLGFTWSQHLENNAGGNPVHVHVAVQTTGGNWFESQQDFPTGTLGQGSQGNYDLQTLTYNPLKANWLTLTLGATGPDGVTVGAQPAVNLTGNIIGMGFVASFVQQSTVHIDFADIGIPPVPGDVDGDRHTTIADYNIIKANFGTNVATRSLGDLNGDGVVNLVDFSQWKINNGLFGSGGGSLSNGSVPEPASAVLMALSLPLGWGMLRLRKKNLSRRLA
jgi:hypothetical protein